MDEERTKQLRKNMQRSIREWLAAIVTTLLIGCVDTYDTSTSAAALEQESAADTGPPPERAWEELRVYSTAGAVVLTPETEELLYGPQRAAIAAIEANWASRFLAHAEAAGLALRPTVVEARWIADVGTELSADGNPAFVSEWQVVTHLGGVTVPDSILMVQTISMPYQTRPDICGGLHGTTSGVKLLLLHVPDEEATPPEPQRAYLLRDGYGATSFATPIEGTGRHRWHQGPELTASQLVLEVTQW